jgi:predicted nicotinamide N-methyase
MARDSFESVTMATFCTATDSEPLAEKETPWIDAWIRWERDSKDVFDEDEDEDEDEVAPAIPTETYSFRYSIPASEDSSKGDETVVDIELRGFPSESEQIWNSTGLTLWRSSHFLCEYMVQHAGDILRDRQIVELGAGLGRCGILAYHLGARVYSTDGDTDTLVQLRDNVDRNIPRTGSNSGGGGMSCHQLLWGRKTTLGFMASHIDGDSVDVVIGSDLVYAPQVIAPLFQTVKTLLANSPSGMFLMAHCSRRVGSSVTISMVLEAADEAGFQYELVENAEDISVYIFRWKGKFLTPE